TYCRLPSVEYRYLARKGLNSVSVDRDNCTAGPHSDLSCRIPKCRQHTNLAYRFRIPPCDSRSSLPLSSRMGPESLGRAEGQSGPATVPLLLIGSIRGTERKAR